MAIVVEVGHIGSHGAETQFLNPVFQFFVESTVFLVEVEVVFFKKIIRHVDVGPAVAVDITNGNAEAEANFAAVNPRIFTDVDKLVAFVAVEFIASFFITDVALAFHQIITSDGFDGIVEQITIEVSVPVIVKKGGVGR